MLLRKIWYGSIIMEQNSLEQNKLTSILNHSLCTLNLLQKIHYHLNPSILLNQDIGAVFTFGSAPRCGVDSIFYKMNEDVVEIMTIIGRQDLNQLIWFKRLRAHVWQKSRNFRKRKTYNWKQLDLGSLKKITLKSASSPSARMLESKLTYCTPLSYKR